MLEAHAQSAAYKQRSLLPQGESTSFLVEETASCSEKAYVCLRRVFEGLWVVSLQIKCLLLNIYMYNVFIVFHNKVFNCAL